MYIRKYLCFLTDGEIPQFDGFVVTAGDDDEAVELEAGDAVRVRLQRHEALSGGQAPHLERFVVGCADDAPRIGLQTANDARVTLGGHPVERGETLARGHVPQLDGAIERTRDDFLPFARETRDRIRVASKRLYTRT